MERRIQKALISVFYKDGLEPLLQQLQAQGVQLYSTGGTQAFIEEMGIPCTAVETVTGYPSILGGRVKTLHPKVFGGILARRQLATDIEQTEQYDIPLFDLVIVDLYPFQETVATTQHEPAIIEKIDIGGVSLIRAAAKNFEEVCILASKDQYAALLSLLQSQNGATSLQQRKSFAAEAFAICAHYDVAIASYFRAHSDKTNFQMSQVHKMPLRYGENPHQKADYFGRLEELFVKLNGKDLSYNNLVDLDAAIQVIANFDDPTFAILKHTNVCGIASRPQISQAWEAALAGDPESAFGGILVTNKEVDLTTATHINDLFFEVLIAPNFAPDALALLQSKKNRILLQQKTPYKPHQEFKHILNGVLVQDADHNAHEEWKEAGGRNSSSHEASDMIFANKVAKFLKSNAIAVVKDAQLIGKGCGQTSRVEALKQAIARAHHFGFNTRGAVLASDGFFPFADCIQLAHEAGIEAVIQPGGSIRDADSIAYAKEHNMALVLTGVRHFKH